MQKRSLSSNHDNTYIDLEMKDQINSKVEKAHNVTVSQTQKMEGS